MWHSEPKWAWFLPNSNSLPLFFAACRGFVTVPAGLPEDLRNLFIFTPPPSAFPKRPSLSPNPTGLKKKKERRKGKKEGRKGGRKKERKKHMYKYRASQMIQVSPNQTYR
jgi:hypothetical protein